MLSSAASGRRKGKPIAPTTLPSARSGTATAEAAYGASAAPSGKSLAKASRVVAATTSPVRAAAVIGARVVSASLAPGSIAGRGPPTGSSHVILPNQRGWFSW
jgi:hypothetical protein